MNNQFQSVSERLKEKAHQQFRQIGEEMPPTQQLLIDWVGREMDNLYYELGQSRDYIQKNIQRKLTTDFDNRPKPIHALAHTQPKKHGITLKPEDEPFILQNRKLNGPSEVYFTPLRTTTLVNAKVRFCAKGNSLQEVANTEEIKLDLKTQNNSELHKGIIWWGIELGEDFDQQSDLHLHIHFENKYAEKINENTPDLSLIQWYTAEKEVESTIGFDDWLAAENQTKNRRLDAEYLFLHQMETDILKHYETLFVSLKTKENWLENENELSVFPKGLTPHFTEAALTEICPKPILWLKMVFPANFSVEQIAQTQIQLNCFPIVNRKLDKSKDRSPSNSDFLEIIPLSNAETHRGSLAETGDYFLGMQKVFAENRQEYQAVTFEEVEQIPKGFYALQAGSVEVNDIRDYYSRVTELAQLLKQDSGLLKQVVGSGLADALDNIEQGTSQLLEGLNRGFILPKVGLPGYYLHIRLLGAPEMIYVRFWVTQGEGLMEIVGNRKILKRNDGFQVKMIG